MPRQNNNLHQITLQLKGLQTNILQINVQQINGSVSIYVSGEGDAEQQNNDILDGRFTALERKYQEKLQKIDKIDIQYKKLEAITQEHGESIQEHEESIDNLRWTTRHCEHVSDKYNESENLQNIYSLDGDPNCNS